MVSVKITIPEKNPSKFFIKLGGLINRRNNTLKKIRFDKKYLYWLTNDPKRYFDKNMPADHNELLWHALVWKRQSLDFPFEKKSQTLSFTVIVISTNWHQSFATFPIQLPNYEKSINILKKQFSKSN